MIAGEGVLGGAAIPGDPGALDDLVGQLRSASSTVASIQSRISANGLAASWQGEAASAFASSLNQLPPEIGKVGSSFGAAADALAGFAGALSDAQSRAVWLADKIASAENELAGASTRHDSAQAELVSARSAHSAATDPVSRTSTLRRVNEASRSVAQAQAALDECNAQIARLRAAADENHQQYERAASTCIAGLDAASHLGIRNSFGSWLERNVVHGLAGHIGSDAWGVAVGAVRYIENAGYETGGDIYDLWTDPTWANAKSVIGDVGRDAAIVAVGLGLALGAAEIGGALAGGTAFGAAIGLGGEDLAGTLEVGGLVGRGLGAVSTTGDVVTLMGDLVGTADGHESVASAERSVTGDVVNLTSDLAGGLIPDANEALPAAFTAGSTWFEDHLEPDVVSGIDSGLQQAVERIPSASGLTMVQVPLATPGVP